jgi:hypothetical protein
MAGALQTYELCDVFEILTENEILTQCNHRNVAHAQLQQALATTCIVENVYSFEGYAFARKKLFRPETATSSRLSEEDELVGDGIHDSARWEEGLQGYSRPARSVKATPSARAWSIVRTVQCYNRGLACTPIDSLCS